MTEKPKHPLAPAVHAPGDKVVLVDAFGEPLNPKEPGVYYEGGTDADRRTAEQHGQWRGKETDVWLAVYVVRGGKPAPLEGNIGQAIHIPSDLFANPTKIQYIAQWSAETAYEALKKAGI